MKKLYLFSLPVLAALLVAPIVVDNNSSSVHAAVGDTICTDINFENAQHGYWSGREFEFAITKEEDNAYEVSFLRPTNPVTQVVMPESILYNGHDYVITKLRGNPSQFDDHSFVKQTSLTSITLPSALQTIEQGAFIDCTSLPSIVIPDSVTTIESAAFYGCTSLTDVTLTSNTPPTLFNNVFGNCNPSLKIHVPGPLVDTYKSSWSAYANNIEGFAVLEDILPVDFPNNETNAWTNGTSKIYADDTSLLLDGVELLPLDTVLISDESNYAFIDSSNNHKFGFYVESGVLTKINLLGFESSKNGDYAAPKINPGKVHNHDGYVAWGDNENETTSLPSTEGSYYLTKDVTISDTWKVPQGQDGQVKTTNLCLNGHVIRYQESESSKTMISVGSYAKLNIFDCDNTTKHYFDKDKTGFWSYKEDQSTPTDNFVTGGLITGATAYCFVSGTLGELNIYGGNIVGNMGKGGSAIRAINKTVFGLYGGLITGNKDLNTSSNVRAAVLINSDNCTVGGNAKVYGNVDSEGSETDLCLYGTETRKITLGTDVFAPEEGMCVGVYAFSQRDKVNIASQITSNGSEDDLQYFFSNNEYLLKYNKTGKYLELVEPTIANILPEDFPIYYIGIPTNAWKNKNGAYLSVFSKKFFYLLYGENEITHMCDEDISTARLTKEEDGSLSFTCKDNIKFTFIMDNGVLVKIVVATNNTELEVLDGEYSEHDLLIYNANGGLAVKGIDYSWGGNELLIKTNDLLVSGSSKNEHIKISSGVNKLSIKDLTINVDGNKALESSTDFTLTLLGDNSFTSSETATLSIGEGEITGDGNLVVSSTNATGFGIMSLSEIKFSQSGTICASGYCGIAVGTLTVSSTIGKIISYTNQKGFSAISGSTFTPNDDVVVLGSTLENADVEDIVDIAQFKDNGFYVENDPAMSILICNKSAVHLEHVAETTHSKVDSTCKEAGHQAYYECSCGKYFSDSDMTQEILDLNAWLTEGGAGYIAPLNHNYVISYTWNEDNTSCIAKAECSRCDDVVTNEATITIEDGYAVASFANDLFVTQRVKLAENTKDGLNTGAIVGISVGSVVGACLISYVAMFFVWKKNEKALKFLTPSFKWINTKIFKK